MAQWTDKHYDFTYTLTEKDIEQGSIKLDPYFISKQWKIGSKDDSGALFHCLKTIARFGDKNDIEREVKALHAQVLGVARSFGVGLETTQTQASLWYPDDSGEWIETSNVDFNTAKEFLKGRYLEVLSEHERCEERYRKTVMSFESCFDGSDLCWGNRVAYKVVE